jgi:LysM repeat protein
MAQPRIVGAIILVSGLVSLNSFAWKSPSILESNSYRKELPNQFFSSENFFIIEEPEPEAENHPATLAKTDGIRYTADISDEELNKLWKKNPEKLGSISLGFTDAGKLINGIPFPEGKNWIVTDPSKSYGTEETIQYVTAAINEVAEKIENTPPICISHLSNRNGGWLRPHLSHQSGRDIDLPIYRLPANETKGKRGLFDVHRNWALVRALVIHGDIQLILLDKKLLKQLYNHAVSIGEDKAWLDSLFRAGRQSLIRHARNHRDHFHVRYYNPRAQELGRRIHSLLPGNKSLVKMVKHRVRRGDTLGALARKYGTSIAEIRRVNRIKANYMRVGKTLMVPQAASYASIPMPPDIVVPPRRLPPELQKNDPLDSA